MRTFINTLLLSMISITAIASVVGIMATDAEELGDVVSLMESPVQVNRGMRTFYRGKLWGTETIIFLSNCGKVASASATVEMIREGVDCIVFLGTAGALDKRLNIGDIVIPKKLIQFDVDFDPFMPPFTLPCKDMMFSTDMNLHRAAFNACSEFLKHDMCAQIDKETSQDMHIEKPKVIDYSVGTADHFLISEKEISNLKIFAPEVACIEMEGAAVAEVAMSYGIPFVAIRTIANYVDSLDSSENFRVAIDYNRFLQKVQSTYNKNILKYFFLQSQLLERKVQSQRLNDSNEETIGILCATEKEAKALCQLFQKPPQVYCRGKQLFRRGKVKNCDVIIASSGFGKAAAAAVATDLILNENSSCIIEVGGAFSSENNVKMGDFVISKNLVEYDVDVRPFRPLFQLPTIGITDLPADKQIVQLAYNQAARSLKGTSHSVHFGQIGSGDKWLDEGRRLILKKELPDLHCVDSQAAPAAQVAYQYGIAFASIKMITENQFFEPMQNDKILEILQNTLEQMVSQK